MWGSVQVAQSCLTVCDPVNYSMPGFPVLHHLPEFAKTHVHWVHEAIQPSCPLSSPFLPTFNLSQHQGLFQWVSSSHQVAKVLEIQLQHVRAVDWRMNSNSSTSAHFPSPSLLLEARLPGRKWYRAKWSLSLTRVPEECGGRGLEESPLFLQLWYQQPPQTTMGSLPQASWAHSTNSRFSQEVFYYRLSLFKFPLLQVSLSQFYQ